MQQLMLVVMLVFVWSACDSSYRESEEDNRVVSGDGLRHVSSHDGDHGDDEDAGEDSGEDSGDRDEDSETCEDDADDIQCDEQAALAAFKKYVQPSIDKSCTSCHAYEAGGLKMEQAEGDAELIAQNRTNLKASAESASAEKLFLKISNQSIAGHKGGDQSDPEKGNLMLAKIESWLAAEVGCR